MSEDNVPCWIPKANSGRGMSFIAIFVAVGLLGGILLGYGVRGIVLTPSFNPQIDGIIENNEYDGANWKIGEYFDVNNTNGDTDGFNYFYVGQTANSLYIAVDLVSDTTNSTDNEWFSIWLNTYNRTFGGLNESWYSFRNNGTENFVYDVDNEEIKPYATDNLVKYNLWVSNTSRFSSILEYGSIISGSWSNTEYNDSSTCIIQSGIDGSTNKILLSFSFDIVNYFNMLPEYKDQLLASITNAKINMTSYLSYAFDRLNDHDITSTKVSIQNNGTYNDAPLIMDESIPTTDHNVININKSAFEDGILNFKIELKNTTAWYMTEMIHFWIDMLRIEFEISQSDYVYGTSTITNNYTLGIGFGASPNSATPHRMYEFRVSKIILENYTANGNLGIYIQGSGLMFEQGGLYYFGVGEQELYFFFFIIWDNADPNWSVNYYYLKMNRKGE